MEKNFLRTRIANLQKLLDEKEAYVRRLEKNIDELYIGTLENEKDNTKIEQKNSKTENIVSDEEAPSAPNKTVQNEKCFYEDQGQCKLGKSCNKIHPRGTCQNHSKYGNCNNKNKCKLRHPVKLCFDWEKKGSCFRREQCRFRHPNNNQRKSFLWKGPHPNKGLPQPLNHVPNQHQPPFLEVPLTYAPVQPQLRNQNVLTTSQPVNPWMNNWLFNQSQY